MDTRGDTAAYRQRLADGSWFWLTTANETVAGTGSNGPGWHYTCSKFRKWGLIH